MPTDKPSQNDDARHYNPKYRKRRKFQGATWTPTNESANLGDGVWCKACRKRHGYKTMLLEYERVSGPSGAWKLLWFCAKTKALVSETVMERKSDDESDPQAEEADG